MICLFITRISTALLCVTGILALTGCMTTSPQPSAADHGASLSTASDERLTLGMVQANIKNGESSQADVATALGAPNIVTQDKDRNETWIYEKISTVTSYSESDRGKSAGVSGGGGLLGVVGNVLGGAVAGGGVSKSESDRSGARSQSQRTMTVIIKFDEDKIVSDVRYQTTSF